MRKIIFILLTLLLSFKGYCQLIQIDTYGKELYESGSSLIELGDYKGADSLLTLSLCSFRNENVYYNRAISRLYLSDTIGFCEDIEIAANRYFDQEASKLFNSICCISADTIFYDRKRNKCQQDKCRYYEIIKELKFDSVIIGTFHYKNAKNHVISFDVGCSNNVIGANARTTDIISLYKMENGVKFYYRPTKSVFMFNNNQYRNTQDRAKSLLNSKYSQIKIDNNKEKLSLYFKIYINDEGEMIDSKYVGIFPEIILDDSYSDLEDDILSIVKHYPKVRPAKFFNTNVNCVVYDSIEF